MSDPVGALRAKARNAIALMFAIAFTLGVADQLIVPFVYFLAIVAAVFLLRFVVAWLRRRWRG